jgi:hypothetical protein
MEHGPPLPGRALHERPGGRGVHEQEADVDDETCLALENPVVGADDLARIGPGMPARDRDRRNAQTLSEPLDVLEEPGREGAGSRDGPRHDDRRSEMLGEESVADTLDHVLAECYKRPVRASSDAS